MEIIEQTTEQQENLLPPEQRIVNILDGSYKCRWSQLGTLASILRHGVLSRDEAGKRRITIDRSTGGPPTWDVIPLMEDFDSVFGNPLEVFGIVVRTRKNSLSGSIDPQKFVGLVIPDRPVKNDLWCWNTSRVMTDPEEKERYLSASIERILEIYRITGKSLPIYGTSGNLYWSRRMDHSAIVSSQSLRARTKNMVENLIGRGGKYTG